MPLSTPLEARLKCMHEQRPGNARPPPRLRFSERGFAGGAVLALAGAWALLALSIGAANAEPVRDEAKALPVAFDLKIIIVPAAAKLGILSASSTEKVTTRFVPADDLDSQIQLLLTESGATVVSMPRVITAHEQKVQIETRQDRSTYSFAGTRCVLLPFLQGNSMKLEIDIEHGSALDQAVRIHAVESLGNGDSVLLGQRRPADNKSDSLFFMITATWNGHGSDFRTKLQQIILPNVQFSGATLEEALEFFRIKSRTACVGEESYRQGINLVLNSASPPATSIDLYLTNIPLIEALKYTAYLADLDMHVDDNAVVFRAKVQNQGKDANTVIQEPEGKAMQKARRLIQPQVQFSGASIEEALEFLRLSYGCSEGVDDRHINFILKPGGKAAAISLDLKDVSMWDAVRYIAEQSNHTVSADDYAIILAPR